MQRKQDGGARTPRFGEHEAVSAASPVLRRLRRPLCSRSCSSGPCFFARRTGSLGISTCAQPLEPELRQVAAASSPTFDSSAPRLCALASTSAHTVERASIACAPLPRPTRPPSPAARRSSPRHLCPPHLIPPRLISITTTPWTTTTTTRPTRRSLTSTRRSSAAAATARTTAATRTTGRASRGGWSTSSRRTRTTTTAARP